VNEQKMGKCCIKCGETDIAKLDFHHRDPTTKLFTIGGPSRSQTAILAEIEKCDLLCHSCHSKHTRKQQILDTKKRNT
jgi:hypothetical protein